MEEHTFNRLKRISYDDMMKVWAKSPLLYEVNAIEKVQKLFNSHGWTIEEYVEYGRRR